MRTNTLERNSLAGTKSLFTRLAVPLFLLCLCNSANAGNHEEPGKADGEIDEAFEEEFLLLEEEQTVVSASRHAQKKSLSPSAITVITREQIASSGALSIPDLLRRIPGVDTVVASPYFTGITARLPHTYENNQFLVLIDGRQANIELLGQAPWESQPISIEDIERIEVIRGPGSALYGANAFAGVVSIFTRALPEKDSAWVQVEGGQWDRLRASARGSVRKGSWAGALSAEYDRAGTFGNQRLAAKEAWKARILCEWRSGDHKLVFDAGFVDSSGYIPTSIGHVTGSFITATARAAYSSKNL
ncbi:MAG: TonB-dependent receptor, partial [Deltaproteobacteria bacterium]